MNINITIKKQKLIKKISGKDAQEVIQNVINDWFENLINNKYKSKKTLTQKVDELGKE